MKATISIHVAVIVLMAGAWAAPAEPFSVSGRLLSESNGLTRAEINISVPTSHYLYADSVKVESDATALQLLTAPASKQKDDPFAGQEVAIYDADARFVYGAAGTVTMPLQVAVEYQGCSPTLCFRPVTVDLSLGGTNGLATAGTDEDGGHEAKDAGMDPAVPAGGERDKPEEAGTNTWQEVAARFTVAGRASGYLGPEAFLNFIDSAKSGKATDTGDWQSMVEQKGWLLACVLIVLGGLALNLTPCVLPMIPINLAIIGAGAEAASRRRGWLLGSTFGAGMAIVYGLLGMVVVLTGARFGALNASPWFNAGIAALFLVMALAMFGIFNIDLSRFQPQSKAGEEKKGSLPAAFVLGGVMALLAGACVAPVVIAVLLFATELHASGMVYAAILPFLLGLGMALPWPFAGAGMSFLPKPGKWMQVVKIVFGVIILGFAVYYGHLAFTLFRNRTMTTREEVRQAQQQSMEDGWLSSLPAALQQAERNNQRVLIDFWATWCKSCLKMNRTTFKDPTVQNAMDSVVKVKYQAEDLSDPGINKILDHFDVVGLPTYVILCPNDPPSPKATPMTNDQ